LEKNPQQVSSELEKSLKEAFKYLSLEIEPNEGLIAPEARCRSHNRSDVILVLNPADLQYLVRLNQQDLRRLTSTFSSLHDDGASRVLSFAGLSLDRPKP